MSLITCLGMSLPGLTCMELPALPVLGCFQLLSLQIVVKAPIKSAAFALGPRPMTPHAPSKVSLSLLQSCGTLYSRPLGLQGLKL